VGFLGDLLRVRVVDTDGHCPLVTACHTRPGVDNACWFHRVSPLRHQPLLHNTLLPHLSMKKFVPPLLNRRPTTNADEPPTKKPKLEPMDDAASGSSDSSTPAPPKPALKLGPTIRRKPLLLAKSTANKVTPATSSTAPTRTSSGGGSGGEEGYYNVLWFESSPAPVVDGVLTF
jgi:hypothetical protein